MGKAHAWDMRYYQREFSIPLSRNIFGLFTIPVYINHVKAVFVVDTGAQISGVKSDKIAQLKLKKTGGSLQIGSIGGTQRDAGTGGRLYAAGWSGGFKHGDDCTGFLRLLPALWKY